MAGWSPWKTCTEELSAAVSLEHFGSKRQCVFKTANVRQVFFFFTFKVLPFNLLSFMKHPKENPLTATQK